MKEAKRRYIDKLTGGSAGLTKTPREQLNDFKKRNKPAVILKMKQVAGSVQSPNILRKPQTIEQVFSKQHPLRNKSSNPKQQITNRMMMTNYPFFFTKQEPEKLAEAPEWYQNKGKRLDGFVEKNTHAPVAGKDFPTQKTTVYTEMLERGARRDPPEIDLFKQNQAKIVNNTVRERITKDTLQNCKSADETRLYKCLNMLCNIM